MKAVTIYEASDGQRFNDPEKCQQYEVLIVSVAAAMAPLGKSPDLGHGCSVQHDRMACLSAKRGLVELARTLYPPEKWPVFQHDADEIHPWGGAGRVLTDGAPECLSMAWNRLMRINWDNYREYDQPYFAMNPDKAGQMEVAQ